MIRAMNRLALQILIATALVVGTGTTGMAKNDSPNSWLSHANLSYLAWKQGDVVRALDEGHLAIDLAPRNRVALMNLATIQEALDSCTDALTIYESIQKLDPENLDSALGAARCEIRSGQMEKGLARLKELSAQSDKRFDWYYKIGDTYLQAGQAGAALTTTDKALAIAIGEAQKSRAEAQLYMALLQTGDFERAALLKERVLQSAEPKNEELYVLSAQLVSTPEEARALFDSAVRDLKDYSDSDAFFRLSRLFTEHSTAAPNAVRDHWLAVAISSIERAIELAPEQFQFHLALAGLQDRLGQREKMIAEVQNAYRSNQYDSFINFLRTSTAGSLTNVHFKVHGMTCGCHVNRVSGTFRNVAGVAFVNPSTLKEYEITIFIDPAVAKLDDVFRECKGHAFDTLPPSKDPRPNLSFEVLSQQSLSTVGDAISAAQLELYRRPLEFKHYFRDVTPAPPSTSVASQLGDGKLNLAN
jgi:tetratricopeptide (TPR) repeat protein